MILLIGFLNSMIFNPEDEDKVFSKVKERAEILGYQVAQIYQDAIKTRPNSSILSRNLSSISDVPDKKSGVISLDPWGQPYHFKITDQEDSSIKINVWSDGPPHSRPTFIDSDNDFTKANQEKMGFELNLKIDFEIN